MILNCDLINKILAKFSVLFWYKKCKKVFGKLIRKIKLFEKKKQSFSKECFVGAYLSIKTTEGFKAIILKIGNTIFNINFKTLLQLLKQILIKID